MSSTTSIEWCDASLSPWEGCTKVSEGCAHCYAEARDRRHLIEKVSHWGPGAPRRVVKGFADNARALNRRAEREVRRLRVFPSVMDPFDAEVAIERFVEFLDVIRTTPNLDWLLLTKRPELWRERMHGALALLSEPGCTDLEGLALFEWVSHWLAGTPPQNVWSGTSVENQKWADIRVPHLLAIPAVIRFLSVEPMLGAVDGTDIGSATRSSAHLSTNALDGSIHRLRRMIGWPDARRCVHWVICGGESGRHCRPMQVEWACMLRDQCEAARVPFFMKQLGGWPNKRNALEDLPEGLRIREFPNVPTMRVFNTPAQAEQAYKERLKP